MTEYTRIRQHLLHSTRARLLRLPQALHWEGRECESRTYLCYSFPRERPALQVESFKFVTGGKGPEREVPHHRCLRDLVIPPIDVRQTSPNYELLRTRASRS